MDVFNNSFWKMYIKTINDLDPGLNLPECVFTLGEGLLRFCASFPKIKGPVISLNLAMSITSSF